MASRRIGTKRLDKQWQEQEQREKENIKAKSQPALNRKASKTKLRRMTSNVFNIFEEKQMLEFKSFFKFIDGNGDGVICEEDLANVYGSLGKIMDESVLDEMVTRRDAKGKRIPLTFHMFLMMFGEKMGDTDSEEIIRSAFRIFDDDNSGSIHEDDLRKWLTTMGDRFTQREVDDLFYKAPISAAGDVNYNEFAKLIRHGKQEKDEPSDTPAQNTPALAPVQKKQSPKLEPKASVGPKLSRKQSKLKDDRKSSKSSSTKKTSEKSSSAKSTSEKSPSMKRASSKSDSSKKVKRDTPRKGKKPSKNN